MLHEIQIIKSKSKVYALDGDGEVFAILPCSCEHVEGTNSEGLPYSNADAGLYEVGSDGEAYNDKDYSDMEKAFGWATIKIDDRWRALHGGGTGLEEPFAPFQAELLPTLGCFRMYNADVYWLLLQKQHAEANGVDVVIHVVD